MARLKVFQGMHDGRNYRMVACANKARAMELLNKPKGIFEKDFAEIRQTDDCMIALSKPETVFWKSIKTSPGVEPRWVEVRLKDQTLVKSRSTGPRLTTTWRSSGRR